MSINPLKIEESDNVPCDAQPAPSVESADALIADYENRVGVMLLGPSIGVTIPRRLRFTSGANSNTGLVPIEVIQPTLWERFVASPFVQFVKEFLNV